MKYNSEFVVTINVTQTIRHTDIIHLPVTNLTNLLLTPSGSTLLILFRTHFHSFTCQQLISNMADFYVLREEELRLDDDFKSL